MYIEVINTFVEIVKSINYIKKRQYSLASKHTVAV